MIINKSKLESNFLHGQTLKPLSSLYEPNNDKIE